MAAPAQNATIRHADDLSGAQRAAVLLMYLEPEAAKSVLQYLSSDEVRRIGIAISDVDAVSPEVVETVVAEFIRAMHEVSVSPHTGRQYALKVLPSLVPGERRARVENAIRRQISTEFEEYIAQRPSRTVATMLQDEHVQTQAVALLLMGQDNASKVLACFDTQDQAEISARMAAIESVPGELADDVENALRQALEDHGTDRWSVDGVARTAQVLGRLGRPQQEPLMDRITERDAELSENLRRRMVVFSDLRTLDQRGVQAILKSIDRETLLLALRGADATMREVFFGNMGKRSAADLREELEIMRPAPRPKLEAAQEEVVQVALRLQEEGTLTLYGVSDELV